MKCYTCSRQGQEVLVYEYGDIRRMGFATPDGYLIQNNQCLRCRKCLKLVADDTQKFKNEYFGK